MGTPSHGSAARAGSTRRVLPQRVCQPYRTVRYDYGNGHSGVAACCALRAPKPAPVRLVGVAERRSASADEINGCLSSRCWTTSSASHRWRGDECFVSYVVKESPLFRWKENTRGHLGREHRKSLPCQIWK